MRVGIGYDLHKLVQGRDLLLGGVRIPFEKGLLGHSDADVLFHATCDALLGAAGLGDIGRHFPDTDPQFKDIPSDVLVTRTLQMIRDKGFAVNNVDATILAEAPKLAPYHHSMEANLARLLLCDPACVNVKATTTEGVGVIGRGEAIAAMCVVTLLPVA